MSEDNQTVTLGRYAFSGCYNVRSVSIPASMTEIGDSVFAYCFSIECFDVSDDNANFVAGSDGLLTKDGKTLVRAFDVEDATIPVGVERIAFGAFSGASCITSLTIPRSVKEIGNGGLGVFDGCDSLTTIKVAKGDAERVKEMIAIPIFRLRRSNDVRSSRMKKQTRIRTLWIDV